MSARLASQLLYPLAGVVVIIVVWALACWLGNIPTVVLPTPVLIAAFCPVSHSVDQARRIGQLADCSPRLTA